MSTPIKNKSQDRACMPVSSDCVVWQGPDIPCIGLCAGQSITKAISDLATLLCESTTGVIDVSSIDFACIVADGDEDPTTLLETLQAIIAKVCETTAPEEPGTQSNIVLLPACLYYTDTEGDTITFLPIEKYSAYLASKICTILSNITSINSQVSNLTTRITALERIVITPSPVASISVTTGCASGPSAGIVRPIQSAFVTFENTFCNLSSVLGNTTSLSSSIASQCVNLATSPQLSEPDLDMNELGGWVNTPITIADSIKNMWLTICDMRTKLATCCGESGLICVPLPVSNVAISAVTISSATLTWTAPDSLSTEPPIEFYVEVYEWNGVSQTGIMLYFVTVSAATTSINIPGDYDPTLNYIAKVTAIYSTCGSSSVSSAIGVLRLPVPTTTTTTTVLATTTTTTTTASGTGVVSIGNVDASGSITDVKVNTTSVISTSGAFPILNAEIFTGSYGPAIPGLSTVQVYTSVATDAPISLSLNTGYTDCLISTGYVEFTGVDLSTNANLTITLQPQGTLCL